MKKFMAAIILLSLIIACDHTIKPQSEINSLLGGYRTEGAANAILGSYGIRLRKGTNAYQRLAVPMWENVAIKKITSIDISNTNKKAIEELGITLPQAVNAKLNTSSNDKESYKLVFIQVCDLAKLRKELKVMINSDTDMLFDIKDPESRLILSLIHI